MSDDERPRKSWREIDRQKDRSTHRREEKPGADERRKKPQQLKSYRAQLDRLFDSGKIADLVAMKGGGGEAEPNENRIKLLARIRDAIDRDAVTQAVDEYVARFGELPADLETLGRVLEHRDPARQLEAMQRIDGLLDRERPKRSRTLLAQLKIIRDVGDDPELVALARKLIGRLE